MTFNSIGRALLKPINTSVIIILGIYTMVWGAWVASPFWSAFGGSVLYSELLQLAPEYFWGFLALFCGAVITYGALKRSYRALTIGAMTGMWHWLMITIFFFWGHWHDPGGITAMVVAVYAAFVWLNIKINHKNNHMTMECLLPK